MGERTFEQYFCKVHNIYKNSTGNKIILTENLNGVRLRCNEQFSCVRLFSNGARQVWQFFLETITPLQCVTLTDHGENFAIKEIKYGIFKDSISPSKHWMNDVERTIPRGENGAISYLISIEFTCRNPATYRSKILFNFGASHILFKRLVIEVLENETQLLPPEITCRQRWTHNLTYDTKLISETLWSLDTSELALVSNFLPESFCLTREAISYNFESTDLYTDVLHERLAYEERQLIGLLHSFSQRTILDTPHALPPEFRRNDDQIPKDANVYMLGVIYLRHDICAETSTISQVLLNSCKYVWVRNLNCGGEILTFELPIISVVSNKVFVRLGLKFVNNARLQYRRVPLVVDVQFQLDRRPYAAMHLSLDRGHDLLPRFITSANIDDAPLSIRRYPAPDEIVHDLDIDQRKFVAKMLSTRWYNTDNEAPILLIGSPGSGKTTTIVRVVQALLDGSERSRCLVCTVSEKAATEYAATFGGCDIVPLFVKQHSTSCHDVDPDVVRFCVCEDDRCIAPTIDQIKSRRVVVTTVGASRHLGEAGLGRDHFTHIFIDEASLLIETEYFIPLQYAKASTTIVFSGETVVHRPMLKIRSGSLKSLSLKRSMIDRLNCSCVENSARRVVLRHNYRASGMVYRFLRESLYDASTFITKRDAVKELNLRFKCVRGVETISETSIYNNDEVQSVLEVVVKRWEKDWLENILVMTMCPAQAKRISEEFSKRKFDKDVKVECYSVNSWCGEYDTVVVSTVRTLGSNDLWVQDDRQLLLAALTRARSRVIVVGDAVALCFMRLPSRTLWRKLVKYCSRFDTLEGITAQCLQRILALTSRIVVGELPERYDFTKENTSSTREEEIKFVNEEASSLVAAASSATQSADEGSEMWDDSEASVAMRSNMTSAATTAVRNLASAVHNEQRVDSWAEKVANAAPRPLESTHRQQRPVEQVAALPVPSFSGRSRPRRDQPQNYDYDNTDIIITKNPNMGEALSGSFMAYVREMMEKLEKESVQGNQKNLNDVMQKELQRAEKRESNVDRLLREGIKRKHYPRDRAGFHTAKHSSNGPSICTVGPDKLTSWQR